MTPQTTRQANIAEYHSSRYPEDFDVDWPTFYRRADSTGAAVRRKASYQAHVRYGDDSAQILNVVAPANPGRDAPVLLFAHGGGFREGHPDHYDHLAAPFIADGAIFVSVGYRLGPGGDTADAIDDFASAIRHVHETIAEGGGSPDRLYVSGHSAGAISAASVALRTNWQIPLGLPADVVKGAVLISAPYDFRDDPGLEFRNHADWERLNPIDHVGGMPEHMILVFGTSEANRRGEDRRRFAAGGAKLARALRETGRTTTVIEMPDATHQDTVTALGTLDSDVYRAVRRMLNGHHR